MKTLTCMMLAAALALTGAASAGSGGVRLHVIGRTDLYADQEFKLQVRDRALEFISEEYGASSPEDIYEQLSHDPGALNDALNEFARERGHSPDITLETGVFPYPDHALGGGSFPAGLYAAIRIRIGGGEGRNWWGVLNAGVKGEDIGDTEYYSSIINWLMRLFGAD